MSTHLWNFKPSRASLCGTALYTHRITANPGAATCTRCYLRWLRELPSPLPQHPRWLRELPLPLHLP